MNNDNFINPNGEYNKTINFLIGSLIKNGIVVYNEDMEPVTIMKKNERLIFDAPNGAYSISEKTTISQLLNIQNEVGIKLLR